MNAQAEDYLPEALQRRNAFVYFLNTSLGYLVAPVFYVGVLHAAILHKLDASDTVANLPESAYLWTMPLPVLIAWLWPSPQLMKPMLGAALFVMGTAGAIIAAIFTLAPPSWIIPAVIAHAALIGICNGVRTMCIWELIGRGMSAERRGRTLGLTFGISPFFAVLGSCLSQLILAGDFLGMLSVTPVPAPWNYVILFGSTAPAMWLAAALVRLAHIPPAASQESGSRITAILLGLRQYFLHRLIFVAALGFLLTYGGTMIMNNLSLYARETMGEEPQRYAGLQLALRFGCKCLAGFALGWLVTRVGPRSSLLATTLSCLAGVCWALVVPGTWYLLSFGLLGAGELFYVYYLNYIIGCSAPERIRENTAYTNLLTVLVGFFPVVFGIVSDAYGLRTSFGAANAMFAAAIVLVLWQLPRQPRRLQGA